MGKNRRHDVLTGQAATDRPDVNRLRLSVVSACPRKGCYRAVGHHAGIHGNPRATNVLRHTR